MSENSPEIRVGIVGLDSSHAVQYATLLHQTDHAHYVPGGRIVAAYAGGSADWDLSYSRVPGFRAQLEQEFSIPVHESIAEVVAESDGIMVLSIDGRVQFEQFAASGKPVYIDKPLTATTADAKRLAAIAAQSSTRVLDEFAPHILVGAWDSRRCRSRPW